MIRTLSAAALAAASLFLSAPANAACVGEQSLFYACATTPTVTLGEHTYCVYAGGDDCENVTVPVPQTSGEVDVYCGGRLYNSIDGGGLPVSLGPGFDDPRC